MTGIGIKQNSIPLFDWIDFGIDVFLVILLIWFIIEIRKRS